MSLAELTRRVVWIVGRFLTALSFEELAEPLVNAE